MRKPAKKAVKNTLVKNKSDYKKSNKKEHVGFKKGNQEYLKRDHSGRYPLFKKASDLWDWFLKYKEDNDKNVWKEKHWVGQHAKLVYKEKVAPLTIAGMCVFFDATRSWWNNFKNAKIQASDTDFLYVIEKIEDSLHKQKFEGAAVGAFKENIIARELGLSDKQEVKNTNLNANVEVSGEEAQAIIERFKKDY